jgi:exosortase/archaeosortase family protein
VAFVLIAGALYAFNGWFRSVEAAAGERSIGLVTDGNTTTIWDQAITLFGLGTRHAMGLRITAGCSSALLILPLFLVGAGFMASRRSTIARILAGTAIGAAVLVVTNQLRLCLIAWFAQEWGHDGFGWAHTVIGSLLSLVGVAASVAILLLLAMRQREPVERLDGAPE